MNGNPQLRRQPQQGQPSAQLRQPQQGAPSAQVRRPRQFHLIESQPQRMESQRRTLKLADDIVPGLRRDKFEQGMRDGNPEEAMGILNLVQKVHGLPPLPEYPIGGV